MEKGTYALLIALEREASIAVGRLGLFAFPEGYYLYVGSARGGLQPRVRRHLGSEKRLRWHIDYLLEHAGVVEVWYAEDLKECLWATVAREMPGARVLVPRFGSSDCRCPSHLIYFPVLPSFELFRHRLEGSGVEVKRALPARFLSPGPR